MLGGTASSLTKCPPAPDPSMHQDCIPHGRKSILLVVSISPPHQVPNTLEESWGHAGVRKEGRKEDDDGFVSASWSIFKRKPH